MISVDWICEASNEEGYGYDVIIPFHKWKIIVSVPDGEESKVIKDIVIFDTNNKDITEDFLVFPPSVGTMRPTGINLFQIMDLLITNLRKEQEEE